jgi:hypothetical protein
MALHIECDFCADWIVGTDYRTLSKAKPGQTYKVVGYFHTWCIHDALRLIEDHRAWADARRDAGVESARSDLPRWELGGSAASGAEHRGVVVPPEVGATSIYNLDLPGGTTRALRRVGIATCEDLAGRTLEGLCEIKGIGIFRAESILKALAALGAGVREGVR